MWLAFQVKPEMAKAQSRVWYLLLLAFALSPFFLPLPLLWSPPLQTGCQLWAGSGALIHSYHISMTLLIRIFKAVHLFWQMAAVSSLLGWVRLFSKPRACRIAWLIQASVCPWWGARQEEGSISLGRFWGHARPVLGREWPRKRWWDCGNMRVERLHTALARGRENETGGSSWGQGTTAAESSSQEMYPLPTPL